LFEIVEFVEPLMQR